MIFFMERVYLQKRFPSNTGCSIPNCKRIHEARGVCKLHWHLLKRKNKLPPKKTIIEKFEERILKTDSCWNWIGTIKTQGYGTFCFNYKKYYSHRFSYELYKNKIPEKFEIDHLCRNRKCVNPDHLEAVTSRINNLRSGSPSAINSKKTHCIRGHEFNKENTYFSKTGRHCKACERKRAIFYRSLKRKDQLLQKQS